MSIIFAVGLLFLLVYVVVGSGQVQYAGQPDTSFATDGVLTVGGDRNFIVQSNGGIIMLGDALYDNPPERETIVRRYFSTGTLDANFATNGAFDTFISSTERHLDAVEQADGKLVFLGMYDPSGVTPVHGFVARLTPLGVLDSSFGTSGIVTFTLPTGGDIYRWGNLDVQDDGKIVIATDDGGSIDGDSIVSVRRFNSDGTVDVDFGGGDVELPFTEVERVQVFGVKSTADNQTVVAGLFEDENTRRSVGWVARFTYTGTLDASFGVHGIVSNTFGIQAYANHVLHLLPNDKILTSGYITYAGEPYFASLLTQYDADGSLDVSFGHQGVVTFTGGQIGTWSTGGALQYDGKVLLAHPLSADDELHFAVTRHQVNGQLDPTFGMNGVISGLVGAYPSHLPTYLMVSPFAAKSYLVVISNDYDNDLRAYSLLGFDLGYYVTKTVASMVSVDLMPSLMLTNTSESACQIEAARHPIPPGGAPADDGEMPMVWELSTDCDSITADLQFSYTDTEILYGNNITEILLSAYVSSDGDVWTDACHTYTCTLDVDTNTIHVAGVDQLGFWSLGNRTEVVEPPPEPVEPPAEPIEYFAYLPIIATSSD